MSIFQEFGGRSSYYTANELDRLQNPEKYNYDQAQYDAFAAQAQKKADSRQAALEASQDAIPYSYVGRGTGATNPAFSFAGYSGQTSGGTAGLAGFGGGGHVDVQQRAEGGVITSPYANPMKQQMGNFKALPMPMEQIKASRIPENLSGLKAQVVPETAQLLNFQEFGGGPMPAPKVQVDRGPMPSSASEFGRGPENFAAVNLQQGPGTMNNSGIGAVFESQFNGGGPLSSYQRYLMETYAAPALNTADQMVREDVDYFVDLVNQAEQAHFGQSMAQPYQQGIGSLPMPY